MPLRPSRRPPRRGSIAVLTAVLTVILLVVVAFAVDLGYVAVACGELQNAADSSAMAGCAKLLDVSLLKNAPDQTTATNNARAEAQRLCQLNRGAGVYLTLDANTGNSSTGDIVCGYLSNPSNQSQALDTTPFPNSVQVRVHRDSTRNGSISMFFAQAFGMRTKDLVATATATYQGNVVGFKAQGSDAFSSKLLPFAMYVGTWNNLLNGTGGTDSFTVTNTPTSTTGTVTSGADGIREGKLFPLGNGSASGNFGMLDLGPPANATGAYTTWIQNGPSASDLGYFTSANGYPNGFQLDPTTGTLTLSGTPGVHAAMESALQGIIGQPRIIPLYSAVAGNGNNATYTIVGFGACTVCDVSLQGSLSSKHITVQPSFVIDASAFSGTITVPPANAPAQQFVYQPVSLTR